MFFHLQKTQNLTGVTTSFDNLESWKNSRRYECEHAQRGYFNSRSNS